jgi:prolyl-tRNA synthetase
MPGSLGAVAGTIRDASALAGVYADHAIRLIGNGVTGANRDGFHLRNVNVQRDLAITSFGDFRRVKPGEPDPRSGQPLEVRRGIEVGHIFKLGTKYAEKFGAVYTDDQKQSHLMVMGCYGIGISRTLQAVIEEHHDDDGIVWPWAIAPFQVLIVVLDPQLAEAADLARALGAAAEQAGADVLIDDRIERPGVKFKDADLIGVPLRVTIGGKGLKDGVIELKPRASKDVVKVPIAEAASRLAAAVAEAASK